MSQVSLPNQSDRPGAMGDKFLPPDSDKIESSFLKHHVVGRLPLTGKEIEGLRIALNVRGFQAMPHASHRVFAVGLAFWFPLPKKKLCDWEDIVAMYKYP